MLVETLNPEILDIAGINLVESCTSRETYEHTSVLFHHLL
jgi:hypothetical protein